MIKLLKFNRIQKSSFVIHLIIYISFSIIGFIYQLSQKPVNISYTKLDFLTLLEHNLSQTLLIIILGLLSISLYNFIAMFINGFAVGIALGLIFQNSKLTAFIFGFIPHAIFEIPATILAASIPLIFYRMLLKCLRQKEGRINAFLKFCIKELPRLTIVPIVLIVIAAFMESFISKF